MTKISIGHMSLGIPGNPPRWFGRSPSAPVRDALVAKLEGALGKPGCSICHLVREQEESHLFHFLWENINDPTTRARLRATLGYCSRHTWLLHDLERQWWGDGLETAIVCEDVLREVVQRLRSVRSGRDSASLESRGGCPICQERGQIEEAYQTALVHHLARPDFRELYARSGGMCLPHLRRSLSLDREFVDYLVEVALATLDSATDVADPTSIANLLYGLELVGLPKDSVGRTREMPGLPCPACTRRLAMEPSTVAGDFAVAVDRGEDHVGSSGDEQSGESGQLCAHHGFVLARLVETADANADGRAALSCQSDVAREWLALVGRRILPRRRRSGILPGWAQLRGGRSEDQTARSTCPACRLVDRVERPAVVEIGGATIKDVETQGQAVTGPLCLQHLTLTLALLPDPRPRQLALIVADQLDQLGDELRQYIHKHSWDYRDEVRGSEQTSPTRATRFLAGEPNAW